jgi:hypothetical protein
VRSGPYHKDGTARVTDDPIGDAARESAFSRLLWRCSARPPAESGSSRGRRTSTSRWYPSCTAGNLPGGGVRHEAVGGGRLRAVPAQWLRGGDSRASPCTEALRRSPHRTKSSGRGPWRELFLRASHFSISTAQKMMVLSAMAIARSAMGNALVSRKPWKRGA